MCESVYGASGNKVVVLSVEVCIADDASVATQRAYAREVVSAAPFVHIHSLVTLQHHYCVNVQES